MSTVLDSILVELGLDPSKFIDGMKKTIEESRKGTDELESHFKRLKGTTDAASSSIEVLTKAAGKLFAALASVQTAKAFATFATHIAMNDAALGRVAANIGIKPQDLAAWGMAAERIGGSPQATYSSVRNLQDKINSTTIGGVMPNEFFYISQEAERLGAKKIPWGKNVNPNDTIFGLNSSLHVLGKQNRPLASKLARDIGYDDSTTNLLIQKGPEFLREWQDIRQKLTPSDEDIRAGERLQAAWAKLYQTFDQLVRIIETANNKEFVGLIDFFTSLVDQLIRIVELGRLSGGGAAGTGETLYRRIELPGTYNRIQRALGRGGYRYEKARGGGGGGSSGGGGAYYYGGAAGGGGGAQGGQREDTYQRVPLPGTHNRIQRALGRGGYKYEKVQGGGGSAGSVGWAAPAPGWITKPEKQAIARSVVEKWRKEGASDAAIAGVLANLRDETPFDPNLREYDQPRFSRSDERGYAHGLYQEGAGEWTAYSKWLNGRDWRDHNLQSEFAAYNLRTNYPSTWAKMNAATKEQAAQIYVNEYLKPATRWRIPRMNKYARGVPGIEYYTEGRGGQGTSPALGSAGPANVGGGGGGLVSPVTGDFGGWSSNHYGAARGWRRRHSGVDWHAATGSAAYAMKGGTVIYRGYSQGYQGNIAILDDDGTTIRRYAVHGATENLAIGAKVAAGSRIGTIDRGHLHYEEIPRDLNGRPNYVFREFLANSRSNSFTSTAHQRGTQLPLGGRLPYGTQVQAGSLLFPNEPNRDLRGYLNHHRETLRKEHIRRIIRVHGAALSSASGPTVRHTTNTTDSHFHSPVVVHSNAMTGKELMGHIKDAIARKAKRAEKPLSESTERAEK
jgi:hypothetical protein